MLSRGLILIAGCLVVGLASPAWADDVAEAKRLNAQAEKQFNLGLFREAAETYQRAYVAKSVPEFLFNMAQCYRRLGGLPDLEKAVFYFESFTNNAPTSPQRPEAEEQLVTLRKELAARRAAASHRPIYKRWWFWTLVGAAVVGATVGTVIGLRPKDQEAVKGSLGDIYQMP